MKKNFRIITILLSVLIFIIVGFLYMKSQYVVPIIMYHRVDDNASISKLSVSPESFKRQMIFLKRNNYNIVSLSELADLVKKGKITLHLSNKHAKKILCWHSLYPLNKSNGVFHHAFRMA